MTVSEQVFGAMIEQIERCQTIDELPQVLGAFVSAYGLKHAVYHAARLGALDKPNPIILTTYSDEWVAHYRSSNYFSIDPTVRYGVAEILPIDWDDLSDISAESRSLFGEAREFDVGRTGLTFRIRSEASDRSLLTITSDLGSSAWKRHRQMMSRDLDAIGMHLHRRVLNVLGLESGNSRSCLTRREQTCLALVADGLLVKQIAAELELSESGINFHLTSARRKLGCRRTGEAVAKAQELNLIGSRLGAAAATHH